MDATEVFALLLLACLVLLVLLGIVASAQRPRSPRPDPDAALAEAEELLAHAIAVRAEAGRAAAAAIEAREAVAAAERHRDAAWAAQETAEREYERAWQAVRDGRAGVNGVHGRIAVDGTDQPAIDGDAEREREIARAALSAYRRGDISVEQLRTVWLRAADLDPDQQERERVAERHRLRRTAARRVHDQAAAAARRADQRARVAEVAAQALTEEAAQSALEAHEAMLVARRHADGPGRRRRRKT